MLDFDVSLGLSANVGDGRLSEFDAGLAILLDGVAADVRLAVEALDVNAVVVAVRDRVPPEPGLRIVIAGDLDAVLVALPDFILNQVRRVVAKLNPNLVQVELVPDHLRIDHERYRVTNRTILKRNLPWRRHQYCN